MQFTELEEIMSQRGITTLADIARALNTTSQAVSNWKDSNHVPSHIITKLEEITFAGNFPVENSKSSIFNALGQPTHPPYIGNAAPTFDGETISIVNIFTTMAEQLKIIVLVAFITVFLVFTYAKFSPQPKYRSSARVVLNSYSGYILENMVMPSSMTLYPELFSSQLFTDRVMDREFYTDKFKKKLPLLAILTHGDEPSKLGRDILMQQAAANLKGNCLDISQGAQPEILNVTVTAQEPRFAKELVEAVLVEIEALHRSFIEEVFDSKLDIVEGQVASAEVAVEGAEQSLKEFNELNNQVLNTVLKREYGILINSLRQEQQLYMALKREQWELDYIKSSFKRKSVMEIIKRPKINSHPFNRNLKRKILHACILGVGLGSLLGFVRSYLHNQCNNDAEAFKKLKYLIKEKPKGVLLDWRVSGIVSIFLLAGSPFYFGCESEFPVFFGRYSPALMIVNTLYIMAIITAICLSIYRYRKNVR